MKIMSPQKYDLHSYIFYIFDLVSINLLYLTILIGFSCLTITIRSGVYYTACFAVKYAYYKIIWKS